MPKNVSTNGKDKEKMSNHSSWSLKITKKELCEEDIEMHLSSS